QEWLPATGRSLGAGHSLADGADGLIRHRIKIGSGDVDGLDDGLVTLRRRERVGDDTLGLVEPVTDGVHDRTIGDGLPRLFEVGFQVVENRRLEIQDRAVDTDAEENAVEIGYLPAV